MRTIHGLLFVLFVLLGCKSQGNETKDAGINKSIANDSIPKATGFVNDLEKLFTPQQVVTLDSIIRDHEKQTSNQIAILTIDSSFCNKKDFDSFVLQVHNAWGIGTKEKNNGVLICISKQMKKVRINNGYGIEKILSNEETKKIIDQTMLPELSKGDYYRATFNGLMAVVKHIS